MDDLPVEVEYDMKRGKIVLHMDSETVKEVFKHMKKKKICTFQLFPDGFIISEEGIFLARANVEKPAGYA